MDINPTNQIVIVKIQTSWRFVSSSTQEARLAGWWHRPQWHQTEVRWRQGAETFWGGSVGEVEAVEDCDRGQEDYPGPYEIWSRQTCRRCLTVDHREITILREGPYGYNLNIVKHRQHVWTEGWWAMTPPPMGSSSGTTTGRCTSLATAMLGTGCPASPVPPDPPSLASRPRCRTGKDGWTTLL